MTTPDSKTPSGGRVFLSEAQIQERVQELGAEISHHYQGQRPFFLGIMNGALFFLTDLLRSVDLECEISCLRLASYTGTQSGETLRGLEALDESFSGRHVLIVDDILDTGRTLGELTRRLRELGAADIKSCVLLQKQRFQEVPVQADWIGFTIPDEFVVGYGLDHDGRYRGLRHIEILPLLAASP